MFFGKINYGGLKHNSLYLGLVLPSGGWQSLILHRGVLRPPAHNLNFSRKTQKNTIVNWWIHARYNSKMLHS